MKTPGERFRYWVENVAVKKLPAFAKIVGVDVANIYFISNNKIKSVISEEILELIYARYPKFPFDWVKNDGPVPGKETALLNPKKAGCPDCEKKGEIIAAQEKSIADLEKLLTQKDDIIEQQKDIISMQKEKIVELKARLGN